MKTKTMLMIVISGTLITSCHKTYVCVDQVGTATREVRARSQNKANSLCQSTNESAKLK